MPHKKVPLTACNTCPLKSAPPIHNFYLNSQSQDKCYSIEKPRRMTNRKVLRGKQGDHMSLPSDRKVVRQIWQIAPLLTCELKHCHVLMKTSIYRILHFSTLETLTQLIRACPTKGPILGSLQIAAHYSNGLRFNFLMGIVWSSSYCLQFKFFSSILKTLTQVTTKGPVREVSKLPLITAMDWPSCPH